jgi:poly(3-hydroxybutyrate) depolymerase
MAATDTPGMFVRHTIDVGGTMREYFVRLPAMYDPNRAYPVVFLWHGAGGSGTSNNVPIQQQQAAQAGAILVGGTALVSATENRTQWQFNNASSPDIAFFDAMLTQIGGQLCIDQSRIFSSGFSSGAWLSNLLGCARRDKVRAYGVVAGGIAGNPMCAPGSIAAWFLHDANDTENRIAGNITARDRLLTANGCGTMTVPEAPTPCVRYQGCRDGYPVVWCETTGAGHTVQSSISGPGMWAFFASF